jgi:two-component system CheB/CheR fusion protein
VEKTHTIYHVLPAAGKPAAPISEDRRTKKVVDFRETIAEGRPGPDVQREADRLMLAEHAPPGAIVDEDMNIVQVRGHTAPYLELSPGEPTRSLLKMAREGLIAGLGKAFKPPDKERRSQRRLRIEGSGQLTEVAITVIRSRLVLPKPISGPVQDCRANGAGDEHKPSNEGAARLRRELAATKVPASIVGRPTLEELGGERRGAGRQRELKPRRRAESAKKN